MQVIYHKDVPRQPFPGGATYQSLVGDELGSTPVRLGIQVSDPGYETPYHSHPYMEILTIIAGTGEAWGEGLEGLLKLEPGMTVVLPAYQRHAFRVTGTGQLVTHGVHASPERIVEVHKPAPGAV
ncbi:MAG: cupin domain-containing protein [Alphaproteobacteria bacterium]|nr:cupin domain-containing protein [Alphaproteobacteria bacterium]